MYFRPAKPSYSQGFARGAGESRFPTLWKGMRWAGIPALGSTGTLLRDVSGRNNHAPPSNPAIWERDSIRFDSSQKYTINWIRF